MHDEPKQHDEPKHTLPPLEWNEDEERRRRRWRFARWGTTLLLLGGGVFAGLRYGRPFLEQHKAWVSQIPGLQESVTSVGRRVDAAEENLRSWAGDREVLQERMAQLEEKARANFAAARKMGDQLRQRLQAEMELRNRAIVSRLENVESRQESDRTRVARLQEELASVRHEMTQQIAQTREQTGQDLNNLTRHVATLDEQVERGDRDLKAVSKQIGRRRIDFELATNRSREIAPGISLKITGANPSYRRVDGWIWLLPDRRTVWVRNQGSQQSLVFYTKQDPRPHELVFTQVTRRSVAGYLIVPEAKEGA